MCISVFMSGTEGLCVCAGRLHTCVSADLEVAVNVFEAQGCGEGGRDGGTPVSVCLRGGVGRVNAVSCSHTDYVHTVPAEFEIFFLFVYTFQIHTSTVYESEICLPF